jgi:hypothetical protein
MLPDPPYTYSASVVRVIDGDTVVLDVDLGFGIWLRSQSFRLTGCNAIERSKPGGKEAKANLIELLPVGTAVLLRSIADDKYGGRYDARLSFGAVADLGRLPDRAGMGRAVGRRRQGARAGLAPSDNVIERARVVAAWVLLVGSVIGWPVTAATVFRHEPQGVLGLSWLAIIIEAASLLTASQVRQDQNRS